MASETENEEFGQLVRDYYRVVEAEMDRFEAEYRSFVERSLDDITVVLRAHLMIEHYLDAHLKAANPAIENWEGARLSFIQKLTLAANRPSELFGLAPGIRRLNAIRNQAVHTLQLSLSSTDLSALSSFVAMWQRAKREPPCTDPKEVIEKFAFWACSILDGSTTSRRNPEHAAVVQRLAEWAQKRQLQ